MATPKLAPTQNPLSFHLAILITSFLLLASKVKSLSFDFTSFQPGDSTITLLGNASISSSGTLELTSHSNPTNNIGRALYATPLQLWDNSTGELASFVTSFSFVVKDFTGYTPADGIAFLIVPSSESQIPDNSGGGNLGLVNSERASNKVVAVEFDSYPNYPREPNYKHIGINVHSTNSLEIVKWQRESGSLVNVSIVYDSVSRILSVLVTNPNGEITTISQVINLKAVLPETVSIGFSATTPNYYRETHDVHSWSFTSALGSSDANEGNINIARYA